MSYATIADVEALMGSVVDPGRTTALLDLSTTLIDSYDSTIAAVSPVPAAAVVVNANMVVRTLANPLGVKSEQLASYATTYGDTYAGMALTPADMALLDTIGSVRPTRVYDIQTPRPCSPQWGYPWFFVIADEEPVAR